MRLVEGIRADLLYKSTNIVLPIDNQDRTEVVELMKVIQSIPIGKEIEVKIKLKKQKRSLDQNGYLWQLIGELSQKLGISRVECYRNYVKDYGQGTPVPIKEEAVEEWCKNWQDRGLGWITEDLGESKRNKGYRIIYCFYGTSVYKTDEMSRLLNAVIEDCKEQGIETLTPNELERIKQYG